MRRGPDEICEVAVQAWRSRRISSAPRPALRGRAVRQCASDDHEHRLSNLALLLTRAPAVDSSTGTALVPSQQNASALGGLARMF